MPYFSNGIPCRITDTSVQRTEDTRLCGLIDQKKVVVGGKTNQKTCQIAPTVMDNVTYEDAVMGEEIFGPIMPIITFDNFDKVVEELKDKNKPLALYLFSSDKKHIKRVGTHADSDNNGKCDTCDYQMTNVTPDNPEQPKDGLGTGAIVGIVIGSVAVAGVGGFALFWFVIKKKSFADLIAVFKKK